MLAAKVRLSAFDTPQEVTNPFDRANLKLGLQELFQGEADDLRPFALHLGRNLSEPFGQGGWQAKRELRIHKWVAK